MTLREQILSLLSDSSYVPLDKPGVAKALDLPKRERRKLEYELRRLLVEGDVVRIKRDRFCIPKDADLATGIIRFRQSGSAIVVPDSDKRNENANSPIQIDAEDTGVSMHGDHVVIRLQDETSNTRRRRRKFEPAGPRGRVIRILKRARTTIVGNLKKTRFFHYVVPDDPRLVHDIYVPDPDQSDLDPKPKIGDKVVVTLHEWEQRHVNPEGEIIEVLGKTHEPEAEFQGILHKYGLVPAFPKSVTEEAIRVSKPVNKKQLKGRLDHRSVYTFTIDPDDAKDFDDALSIEVLSDKLTRIGIHIADVGAYVKPGTAMDKEAQERGNSTYLVGTVIPMLPHDLSSGICSLKEDEDRLTKSVFLTFNERGILQDIAFSNTVIRSNKRLTYRQAYALLFEDDLKACAKVRLPPSHQTGFTGRALAALPHEELSTLQEYVRLLWRFGSKLRKDRMKKGSLNLDMPETKIFVDENGYADRLEKIVNDESHQLIEEFMLAANEAVAKELKNARMPCIYRVHEKPDEERLQELREFLATFDISAGDLTLRPQMKKLLTILEDHPQGHLLKTQVLRSLKKACYRATPDGHYGLFKNNYSHFTSPIRRYSDLVVHRSFEMHLVRNLGRDKLEGPLPKIDMKKVNTLAEHLSMTESNSTDAERESVKIKQLEFFEREIDKRVKTKFGAIITEIRNHGMFVELVESGAFGLVHMSTFRDDLYRISHDKTAIVGRRSKNRFEAGQNIEVVVERVDRFKRQVDFRVATQGPKTNARPHSNRRKKRSPR